MIAYSYDFNFRVDIDEELCDGNAPLVNRRTGLEFDCDSGRDICPPNSYCHRVGAMSRCCPEGKGVLKEGSMGFER